MTSKYQIHLSLNSQCILLIEVACQSMSFEVLIYSGCFAKVPEITHVQVFHLLRLKRFLCHFICNWKIELCSFFDFTSCFEGRYILRWLQQLPLQS